MYYLLFIILLTRPGLFLLQSLQVSLGLVLEAGSILNVQILL